MQFKTSHKKIILIYIFIRHKFLEKKVVGTMYNVHIMTYIFIISGYVTISCVGK